jgi:hypothetical protein
VWTGSELLGGDEPSSGATFADSELIAFNPRTLAVRNMPGAYDTCATLHVFTGTFAVSWSATQCASRTAIPYVAYDPSTGTIAGVPQAPIVDRHAEGFAVDASGRTYVFGGQDATNHYLDDGAALTLP